MTGEQNLKLIRRIEEHREFLLTVLSQNPTLLARAEPRVRELMEPLPIARWRLDDLDAGRIEAVPGDEVFEKVRRRLCRPGASE